MSRLGIGTVELRSNGRHSIVSVTVRVDLLETDNGWCRVRLERPSELRAGDDTPFTSAESLRKTCESATLSGALFAYRQLRDDYRLGIDVVGLAGEALGQFCGDGFANAAVIAVCNSLEASWRELLREHMGEWSPVLTNRAKTPPSIGCAKACLKADEPV